MIRIGEREIGEGARPYLIAEMSGNHNQSIDRALAIIDAAAEAGADAVKLQTYTAETMTVDVDAPGFVITDPASLWHGRNLYDLYDEAHTPWDWHAPLMARARERGMHCFSTPFDASAVDFLETLDVPAYKIASFECTDLPLIRKVARTGKPVIISTGMASLGEIDQAVRAVRSEGNDRIVLLKCTSTYPATPENSNIRTIPALRAAFGTEVGLSDHTMGCGVAVASVALGACVFEKHFTTARADGGVDSAFSLEPHEFRQLRDETERAWLALGEVTFGTQKAEEGSVQFRRSLYVVADMKAGDVLTPANLRAIRPGFGLPPALIDTVMGMALERDAPRGTPLSWDLLKPAH
jgi:N-acetylneuraminate synthase